MSPALEQRFQLSGVELSQREIDQARLELLRRRVTTFGTVVGLLLMLLAAIQLWVSSVLPSGSGARPGLLAALGSIVVGVAIIVSPRVRRRQIQQTTLHSLVWRTIWIVTFTVLSQAIGAMVLSAGITQALRPLGFEGTLGPIFVLVVFVVVLHTAAAVIVPWTVLEACVPPAAWAGITLIASLFGNDSPDAVLFGVSLTLLAGVPGVAITFFRAGGLRETLGLRLIGARYAEVERELLFARRLHERLFPGPVRDGPIRLEYAYEPMRQIGGDFLDVSRARDGSLLVVMIDVTGHGVAAALAVNRLHGEMKRLLAESHETTPADIIKALNKYVHLTLADESVFATAVAARVWPDGRARLCVAGHPPPLLRGADGSVSSIQPTAAMLGPFTPEEFAADDAELRLSHGDALMLYTDGTIEARDAKGDDLGQTALERFLAEATERESLPDAVLRRITAYRSSAAEDDVLIAAITMSPAP